MDERFELAGLCVVDGENRIVAKGLREDALRDIVAKVLKRARKSNSLLQLVRVGGKLLGGFPLFYLLFTLVGEYFMRHKFNCQ